MKKFMLLQLNIFREAKIKDYTVSTLTILLLNSTSVFADNLCTKNYIPVEINAFLDIITSSSSLANPSGCPFMDNTKATEKYFPGSIYPGSPSCVSGSLVPSGDNKITINGQTYNIVSGYSESAQRSFAEAEAINGINGDHLSISSYDAVPPQRLFVSGAASTLIHISWQQAIGGNIFSTDLFLDDRFLTEVNLLNGVATDHEEFFGVATGPGGVFKDIKGRLRGEGTVGSFAPLSINDFHVTGTFCAKLQ